LDNSARAFISALALGLFGFGLGTPSVASPGVGDFQVPALSGPVVDQGQFFSTSERDGLARAIRSLRARRGLQVQVLTLQDLSGFTVEEVALQVAETWRLGRKGDDDGILILISRKERKARIEVGTGLEGQLPDMRAKQILDANLVPALRAGNAAVGITNCLKAIEATIGAEAGETSQALADSPSKGTSRQSRGNYGLLIFVFGGLFLLFQRFESAMSRMAGGTWNARPRSGRSSSGQSIRWDSSDSWGGGGDSGGGWSGGGGGFSGGGASSDW